MRIHEFKCFGLHAGSGNTALVIESDRSDHATRLDFARAQKRSASVFIDAAPDGDQDAAFALDYVYPHGRSPLCLHATLAAAQVLLVHPTAGDAIVVRTAMRGQLLTLSKRTDGLFITLARQTSPTPTTGAALAARLLNDAAIVLVSAPVLASVGSPKLLLEVADSATLRALQPDLAAIAAWGKEHGVSGCYAYCQLPDGACEGRNFNHVDATMEDSATGVAAAALTLHLGRDLTVYQGAALGQPCVLRTRLEGSHQVLLGGAIEPVDYKEL
jgi:PhzF family phenazine biosynthesis protein